MYGFQAKNKDSGGKLDIRLESVLSVHSKVKQLGKQGSKP